VTSGGGEGHLLPGVLYEDESVLAVDKPAGRLVIPGRGPAETSLREELEARFGRLWVVHRLDRGTSGVLLFARSAEAHRAANLAFDRGEPRKRYLALVRGTPPAERRIELAVAPARRGRMRPARPGDPRGKRAVTVVRLVEVDPDYGDEEPLRGPDGAVLVARTPLHAARLELRHPTRAAPLAIEAPLPADMAAALAALRAG
jgi:tRNA pseudouridine32 synthase/23S rRNA pseudouridine746 synthase